MVKGNFANNRLPGRRVLSEDEQRGFYVSPHKVQRESQQTVSHSVQQVQYQAQAADGTTISGEKEPGMKTTTIRVPRSMAERMAASPPVLLQAQRAPQPVRVSSTMSNPPMNHQATGVSRMGQVTPDSATHANPQLTPQNATPLPGSSRLPSHPHPTNGTGVTNPHLGEQGFIGADSRNSVSATSRAWARQHEQSARFELPRFRVPTKPGVQRHLGRDPSQPSP